MKDNLTEQCRKEKDTYIVFGYTLVEQEVEVRAYTASDAVWEAEAEGLIRTYDVKKVKENNDESN